MAPPKPRKKLAKASAAASHWLNMATGENREAAQRNYDFIQKLIRKSGGALSEREYALTKDFKPPPAPKPRALALSPDAADRSDLARDRNALRGAAPSGGPGKAERERATKAFTAAKKDRPALIRRELERAGYDIPVPKTRAELKAATADVRADLDDYLAKLSASEKATWETAAADPFNIKRNTKLIGKKEAYGLYGKAREKYPKLDPMRPALPEPKDWATKAVEGEMEYAANHPVYGPMLSGLGHIPWLKNVLVEDAKRVAVGSMLGIPALAETAYNDVTGRTRWGLAKLALEGGKEFAKIVEAGLPLDVVTLGKAAMETARTGDAKAGLKVLTGDVGQAYTQWTTKPVETAINVIPGVNVASRAVSIPMLAARMARLNPHLSRLEAMNAARKESYVPGWAARNDIKGGIPERVFTGKIYEDGELVKTFPAPAPAWSRTPVGRAGQKVGQAMGKEWVTPGGRVIKAGPLSETARATNALTRRRGMHWERVRVDLLQQMGPITSYLKTAKIPKVAKERYLNILAEHRTRLAETFYGPSGPDGTPVEDILQAVVNDLRTMQDEGGLDIPTKRKGAIDKRLDKLDRELSRLGGGINESAGLWAKAQDMMRAAGRSDPEIRTHMELAKARARVWARSKPGRKAQDWLESPEGRNLAGFVFGHPEARRAAAGVDDELDLAAQGDTLFQRAPTRLAENDDHQRLIDELVAAEAKWDGVRQLPDKGKSEEAVANRKIKNEVAAEVARAKNEELFHRAWYRSKTYKEGAKSSPERRALAEKILEEYKDREGALPPNVRTPEQLEQVMSLLDELADQGEWGRMWYERSASAILRLAGGNKKTAARFAQLLAIYSPQQPIIGNMSLAIRAYTQYRFTGKVTTGQDWQQKAAYGVLSDTDEWNGRKTNNFYLNFLEDIDPARYRAERKQFFEESGGTAGREVTNDLWMARVFGYLTDQVSEGRYDVMEAITRQIADDRGWKPKQVQAAVWTAIKGISDDVSANIDFSDALDRHVGEISYEVNPGAIVDPELREMFDSWDPDVQAGFLDGSVMIMDDFLAEAGILRLPGMHGPGGGAARVLTSAIAKDTNVVSKVERQLYGVVAAAIGRVGRHGSVGWLRAMPDRPRKDAGAFSINPGRRMTDAEVKKLDAELNADGEKRFIIRQRGAKGVVVTQNPKLKKQLPNYAAARAAYAESFQGRVETAATNLYGDDVDLKYHAYDGDTVEEAEYRAHLEGDGRDEGGLAGVVRLPDALLSLDRRYADHLRAFQADPEAASAAVLAQRSSRSRKERREERKLERKAVAGPKLEDVLYQRDGPREMRGYETRIPVLIDRRDMSKTIIGMPGDTHGELLPEDMLPDYFQSEITIDPTNGKVLYSPREVGDVEAQRHVDYYLSIHYPDGVAGEGPRVPDDATIEHHEITEPSDLGHEGTKRIPWIYDPDSGILHVGTEGSDHTQLSRKVYDKYGYNESLNREWLGAWSPTSQRAVLHGNETGDMPSADFPVDPRLGPAIEKAFGKKLKMWDHETGEVLDMPSESGLEHGLGTRYAQSDALGEIRGGVQFLDTESGRQLLFLTDKANASTFAHELFGHAADEMRREYPEMFAEVERVYGKKYENWKEPEHERFARETERYLMSGKAPVPELEPIFQQMRKWMYHVYETIKALGRPMPKETRVLLDRYFGKEPLEFEAPKDISRRTTLPDPKDPVGINRLAQESIDILSRPDLELDPRRRKTVAGNMLWLDQQVLPYIDELDGAVANKVNEAVALFEQKKAGKSIFTPEQAAAIREYGELIGARGRELEKSEQSLAAQPDHVKMAMAREVIEALDDPDIDLEGLFEASSDLHDVMYEVDQKTKFDHARQKRMNRQIKDIERALKNPRNKAERDEAVAMVREISEQNEKIFIDVFGEGLSPEELATLKDALDRRANILTQRLREIGELPEGEGTGAYLPHYSIYDMVSTRLRGAVRAPAAGRNRKIIALDPKKEGFGGKGTNRLVRYQTAELSVSPAGLLSQYMNRMRFVETANLRKEIFDIGVEIPRSTGRVPKGWYVINGSGAALPDRIKTMMHMSDEQIDEMLASGEDFDAKISSDDGMVKTLEQYRDAFLQQTYTGKIPDDWKGQNVRMVPPEIVDRMIGKVFETSPSGRFAATMGMAAIMGRFSTIYAHAPGYIGANVLANTVMLGTTKPGSFARGLHEFSRMPGTIRSGSPEMYHWMASETGDVMAEAGLPDFYVASQNRFQRTERAMTDFSSKWAGTLGDIADRPFRVASWVGEARREGFKNMEQWKELRDAPDGSELARVRDTIAQRARENMIDFNKLSPSEKVAARWVFIWPFVRGATKWPFWMISEYPGRAAALANLARAQNLAYGEDDPQSVEERYNERAPVGERSMFDLFQYPTPGGGNINLSPIHPAGMLVEKMDEATRLMGGDVKVLGDVLNPSFRSGGQAIFGDRGFDPKALAEVTIPFYSYYRAATEPRKRGAQVYNDRDSFWDYIRRREGRFWPEDVDYEKVKEAKVKEDKEADKRPAWEKSIDEDQETAEKILAEAKKRGVEVSPEDKAAIKKSIDAYYALDKYEDQYKDELGKNELSELEKIEATERVFRDFYPRYVDEYLVDRAVIEKLPETKRGGGDSQASYRQNLRDAIQYWRSQAWTSGRDWKIVKKGE